MATSVASASPSDGLIFPHRQNTRLTVILTTTSPSGARSQSRNTGTTRENTIGSNLSLDALLTDAQREVIEEEIFSLLVKEAGNLPTASARVSERLIAIDAAQGVELKFELVWM